MLKFRRNNWKQKLHPSHMLDAWALWVCIVAPWRSPSISPKHTYTVHIFPWKAKTPNHVGGCLSFTFFFHLKQFAVALLLFYFSDQKQIKLLEKDNEIPHSFLGVRIIIDLTSDFLGIVGNALTNFMYNQRMIAACGAIITYFHYLRKEKKNNFYSVRHKYYCNNFPSLGTGSIQIRVN